MSRPTVVVSEAVKRKKNCTYNQDTLIPTVDREKRLERHVKFQTNQLQCNIEMIFLTGNVFKKFSDQKR